MTAPRFAPAPSWATDRSADMDGITYTCDVEDILIADTTSHGMKPVVITFGLIEHHNIDGSIEFSRVEWRKPGLDMTDLNPEDAIKFAQALERTAWVLLGREGKA